MRDFVIIVTILAGATLLGVIVYGFFEEWHKKNKPYWDTWTVSFDRLYTVYTISRFEVECRLKGFIRKADPDEFRERRMLDAKSQDELLDNRFYNDILCPILQQSGVQARWSARDTIAEFVFVRLLQGTKEKFLRAKAVAFDIRGRCNEKDWKHHGCQVVVSDVEFGIWTPKVLERNIEMLGVDDLKLAAIDPTGIMAEERAVIAALKRWNELKKVLNEGCVEQAFAGRNLQIRTTCLEDSLRIDWSMTGKGTVFGYRREGSFAPDVYGDNNGELVVHAFGTGSAVERLDSGKTYCYTFQLNPSDKEDWVRFTAQASRTLDRAKQMQEAVRISDLERRLAQLANAKPSPPPEEPTDPRVKQWRQSTAFMQARMKMKAETVTMKRQAREQTQASEAFKQSSPDEQQAWLVWLDQQFENMEENLNTIHV